MWPRPTGYLGELRACAEKIENDLWTFDEDAPCFKRMREKYAGYVPTAEDLARVAVAKAEYRARRDEYTRRLWAMLHSFCRTADAADPTKLAGFLAAVRRGIPCGDCLGHWDEILTMFPPDAARPFEWSVDAHNGVNRILGKRQWPTAEAAARW